MPQKLMLVMLITLLGTACSTVKPWQKGNLTKPGMVWQEPMTDQLHSQFYFSKEGSSGGKAAAGGGCGCN